MTKHVTHEVTYDAPLAEVAAMLADAGYREEVATAQASIRTTVEIDGSGPGMSVLIDQVLPVGKVPSVAKKFMGDEINIVQREQWTTLEHADLHVSVPGRPGDMTGSVALTGSGASTTYTVDVAIKASIPLVGGKIEGLIADMFSKALRAESRVARDYLSR